MSKFLNVEISAENQEQADKILNALLEKKLVTGGQFIKAPARFRWEGKIVDIDYMAITSFTIEKHKEEIVKTINQTSEESVPMIRFMLFDGNEELLQWIEETVL
jgi:uncharacterized protein involved in tolerance to divalent cations